MVCLTTSWLGRSSKFSIPPCLSKQVFTNVDSVLPGLDILDYLGPLGGTGE